MSQNNYIGRGELLTKKILLRLLNSVGIQGQVNIQDIILPEDYEILDEEITNHNFDWVVRRTNAPDIVVEVNYKHGEKAAQKYRQIFGPLVIKAGHLFLEINDWDCRSSIKKTLGLFHKNTKGEHIHSWNDYLDIIDALKSSKINPDIYLE